MYICTWYKDFVPHTSTRVRGTRYTHTGTYVQCTMYKYNVPMYYVLVLCTMYYVLCTSTRYIVACACSIVVEDILSTRTYVHMYIARGSRGTK